MPQLRRLPLLRWLLTTIISNFNVRHKIPVNPHHIFDCSSSPNFVAVVCSIPLHMNGNSEIATLAMHRLVIDSPDLDEKISRVLALSNAIFSSDPSSKYASLPYWRARLAEPSAVLLYLTAPAPTQTPTNDHSRDVEPIAFLFAHPRTHAPPIHNGAADSLHIWLAGVAPEWRRGGCLGKLVEELRMGSADRHLTVCTYPIIFPDMWT